MNKRDLIDAIALIVIMCGLAIYNRVLSAKNDLKQNRINELNKIDFTIYLTPIKKFAMQTLCKKKAAEF